MASISSNRCSIAWSTAQDHPAQWPASRSGWRGHNLHCRDRRRLGQGGVVGQRSVDCFSIGAARLGHHSRRSHAHGRRHHGGRCTGHQREFLPGLIGDDRGGRRRIGGNLPRADQRGWSGCLECCRVDFGIARRDHRGIVIQRTRIVRLPGILGSRLADVRQLASGGNEMAIDRRSAMRIIALLGAGPSPGKPGSPPPTSTSTIRWNNIRPDGGGTNVPPAVPIDASPTLMISPPTYGEPLPCELGVSASNSSI